MKKAIKQLIILCFFLVSLYGFHLNSALADACFLPNQHYNAKLLLSNSEDNAESTNGKHSIPDSIINCLGAIIGGVITAITTSKIQTREKEKENAKAVIKSLIIDFQKKLEQKNIDVNGAVESFRYKITEDSAYIDVVKIWNQRIMPKNKLSDLESKICTKVKELDVCKDGNRQNKKAEIVDNICQLLKDYLKIL